MGLPPWHAALQVHLTMILQPLPHDIRTPISHHFKRSRDVVLIEEDEFLHERCSISA